MDYNKKYDQLIEAARNRSNQGYVESHHIVPRCMGGDDSPSNLVDLTAREHFIAHILLTRIYPDHIGIARAALMMVTRGYSSRVYQRLRVQVSQHMRDNNPNAGGKARRGKTFVRKAVLTEQGRETLSRKMLENNPNADGSVRRKVVVLLNEAREIVHRFPSLKEAEQTIGANHSSVNNNRKRGTMYRGFYWLFEDELK